MKHVSKPLYLSVVIIMNVISAMLIGYALIEREPEALALVMIPAIVVVVVTMRLWYLAWSSIQDGYARTTPGKAVGFVFIPIFNIYWVFQLVWGFASDYNAFIHRHKLSFKPLPEWFFVINVILSLVTSVLSRIPDRDILEFSFLLMTVEAVLWLILLNFIINATNAAYSVADQLDASGGETAQPGAVPSQALPAAAQPSGKLHLLAAWVPLISGGVAVINHLSAKFGIFLYGHLLTAYVLFLVQWGLLIWLAAFSRHQLLKIIAIVLCAAALIMVAVNRWQIMSPFTLLE